MSLSSLALIVASLALTASAVQPQHSAAFLGMNASSGSGLYGKGGCPCVGIDNLRGWYSLAFGGYHTQYPIETGSSCEAWDKNRYPTCKKENPADWCHQKWCYVDPCNCDLETLPKPTLSGAKYMGSPAYWSYATCGAKDSFSSTAKGKEKFCVNQETEDKCSKLPKCAWDGKQCAGKEMVKTCKKLEDLDASKVGQEDCRCVGIDNKNGIAKLWMNDTHEIDYPADVGGRCEAWEKTTHPDCKKKGKKPSWCESKWCWVDPCKCKTLKPPSAVMKLNEFKFQGKTAHWSYEACGSKNTWSSGENKDKYCSNKKSKSDCHTLEKCAWTGKECLTKEVAEICNAKGVKAEQKSGASHLGSAVAGLLMLGALATA